MQQTQELHNKLKLISSKLDVCAQVLTGDLLYLDYPLHHNFGDLLIWLGARRFLKRHKKKVIGSHCLNNLQKGALTQALRCSTICFHGGGNLGDLWPYHQEFREKIIQEFPHKRIVIFPQSVHFQSPENFDRAAAIFKAHPDLHIFVRDENSFQLLKDKGIKNLALCPDMAMALYDIMPNQPATNDSSPLYLLRNDLEKGSLPTEVTAHEAESTDWENMLTGWLGTVYKLGLFAHRLDRRFNNSLHVDFFWAIVSHLFLRRTIKIFRQHSCIITNRLHATILATLLNKPSIVYDNSYKKISSYVKLWLSDVQNIDLRAP